MHFEIFLLCHLYIAFIFVCIDCMQCLDYSDDEMERKAKAKLRTRGAVKDEDSGNVEDDDSSSVEDSNSPQKTTKCRRRRQYVHLSYVYSLITVSSALR